MIKILITDDHAIVRKGLKQILDEEPGLAYVGEAETPEEMLRMVREQAWDLVILDINLPGRTGLDLLPDLNHSFPNLPVLILSIYSEDQYALRVLKAGAAGFLNKQCAPDELIRAIKRIHAGSRYISENLAIKIASGIESSSKRPDMGILSDREYQTVIMIASGKSVSEIAEILSLSIKTISTYRSRALEKLGLKTNAELAALAIRNGLVD